MVELKFLLLVKVALFNCASTGCAL